MDIVDQLEVAKFIKRQEIFNQSLEYALSQELPAFHARFSEIHSEYMGEYLSWKEKLEKLVQNTSDLADHATPLNP